MNPFDTGIVGFDGHRVQEFGAEGRVRMVAVFGREDCMAALKVRGLQKTVRTAVERRLRQLQRAKP